MAIDLLALWDFSKPELSEQRFRDALESATPDEQLILQTQIARSFGLRSDFAAAQEVLASIEPMLSQASDEVRVRYYLELGRTCSSTAHGEGPQPSEVREQARDC